MALDDTFSDHYGNGNERGTSESALPHTQRTNDEQAGIMPFPGTTEAAKKVQEVAASPTIPLLYANYEGKVFSPADTLPRVIEDMPRESQPIRPASALPTSVFEEAGSIPVAFPVTPLPLPSDAYRQRGEAEEDDSPNPAALSASNRYPGKHRRVRRLWLIILTLLLLLLLVGGVAVYSLSTAFNPVAITSHLSSIPFRLLPTAPAATATVTITPTRNLLGATYTIYAVPGSPNAAQQQVGARLLSATSATQSSTVAATGKGTIPATRAAGMLSIQNLGGTQLSMAAGQGFVDYTGKQSVIIDTTIYIAPYSTVAVHGHSGNLGASGNMNAYYFNFDYGWQGSTILLQNTTAMSGGQDAQSYTYLQNSDINSVVAAANQLKASLAASTQSNIYGQVRSNERLITAVPCTPHVSYNHRVGDRVSSVTTTVSATCTGEVYDAQGALSLASTLLHTRVFSPYLSYTLIGPITPSLLSAVIVNGNGTIALQVKAVGRGQFQFSDAQKRDLAKLIVGNSLPFARSLLLKQLGISQVSITISGGNSLTLPIDSEHISVVVQR